MSNRCGTMGGKLIFRGNRRPLSKTCLSPSSSTANPTWSNHLSFEPRSGHVGFVMDKVTLGQVFSSTSVSPCQVSFHQTVPHLSSIIRGSYNRPVSGRHSKWTHKGMVRSDMSKPALIFFSPQEYTQQNPLSKFYLQRRTASIFWKLLNIANIVNCQTLGEMSTPSRARHIALWRHGCV
jgi:hypothetical protein